MSIEAHHGYSGVGIVKFLGKGGEYGQEGHRGLLLATRVGSTQAIVLALTESFDPSDGVVHGSMYLVKELNPEHHPYMDCKVSEIPPTPRWHLQVDFFDDDEDVVAPEAN